MDKAFKIPPKSLKHLTEITKLPEILKVLIGREFKLTDTYKNPDSSIANEPSFQNLYSIKLLTEMVAKKLIGKKLDNNATKNRGQALERLTLELLGYKMRDFDKLVGGFPDIPNQLLEVKVQDTQTVDLGRFTPEKEEEIGRASCWERV